MEARIHNALLRKTIQVRRLRHGTTNAEITESNVVAYDQQDVRGLTCALISGTLRRSAVDSLRCGFVYRGSCRRLAFRAIGQSIVCIFASCQTLFVATQAENQNYGTQSRQNSEFWKSHELTAWR